MKLLRWTLAGASAYVIYKYAIGKKATGEEVFQSPPPEAEKTAPAAKKAPAKKAPAKKAPAKPRRRQGGRREARETPQRQGAARQLEQLEVPEVGDVFLDQAG
jgi:hypothetical protein